MSWMTGAPSPLRRGLARALLSALLAAAAGAADVPGSASPPPAAVQKPSRVEFLGEDGKLQWRELPAVVEFEALLPHLKASAGEPVRQEMAGFGPGWGGSAQVFWRPPAPVDAPIRNWPWLRTLPVVAAAGRYRMTLVHTVAPDYGTVRIFVKGEPVADFNGYGPGVAQRRLDLGERQLGAGPVEVLFTVFSKDPKSTGYCVGLDRIELQPVH
jgi:hypothetical protein